VASRQTKPFATTVTVCRAPWYSRTSTVSGLRRLGRSLCDLLPRARLSRCLACQSRRPRTDVAAVRQMARQGTHPRRTSIFTASHLHASSGRNATQSRSQGKYDQLLRAGKSGKVAVTATMRKLIVMANALLRDGRKGQNLSLDQNGYSSSLLEWLR
jgi:hypothetical protein